MLTQVELRSISDILLPTFVLGSEERVSLHKTVPLSNRIGSTPS